MQRVQREKFRQKQTVKPMKAEIVIEGQPVGKGRPKFARQGQFVKAYTPEKTADYEELVRTIYRLKAKDEHFRTVYFQKDIPLRIHIRAYYKIPKNTAKALRADMLDGKIRPLVKPDFDNVEKIICDALNGIAYQDDKQIVENYMQKFYSDKPRVEVTLEEISGKDLVQ